LNKLLPLVAFSVLLLVPAGAQNAFATDEDDVIFDGGRSDFVASCLLNDGPLNLCAEDFKLQKATNLRDVHVDIIQFVIPDLVDAEFSYKIYEDSKLFPGTPGVQIREGVGINVHRVPNVEVGAGSFDFRYWFDLDNEIFLQADTTYWLQLEVTNLPKDITTEVTWRTTTPGFGNPIATSSNGGVTWTAGPSSHLNLVLTGGDDEVVGGEFLPIDSAALLLAAAQAPAAWLTTLTIAALGIGAYVFTRNPSNMRNIKVILRDYLDRF